MLIDQEPVSLTPRTSQRAVSVDRVYDEEVKNMLCMLEHYKLQLSLVLPKICLLMRRARDKGNALKLEKTKHTSKYSDLLGLH